MSDDDKPAGTFGDYAPSNDMAIEIASNYEICERSGFKVEAGRLKKEWDGLRVRGKDLDYRHPQELLRSRPESSRPCRSPEPPDEFLAIDEITTADL